jgi:translation initiation factor IF-2
METQLQKGSRHPVVVILGHVDHGKTSLLDFIRKSKVVAGESGGITQHMGAYEIDVDGKKITFLDTPGHETFSAMRSRGAHVADIAVLVIAADDGIKPQTKESIDSINQAKIPFVVALNKIDKSTADVDRVKGELAKENILVEGWGGTIPVVGISAKEGTNIDELIETILLLAEMAELKGSTEGMAQGVVIESHLDARRGPSALLLITEGVLKKGEFVLAGDISSPVRILEDTKGQSVQEAGPSSTVTVVGFSAVPAVGVTFKAYESKSELEDDVDSSDKKIEKKGVSEIGIMIKADASGSLEALSAEIHGNVPDDVDVTFFDGGVGDISEVDIKNISSAQHAYIIGFHVKAKKGVDELAERFGVQVKTFDIIYEAIDWIQEILKTFVPRKIVREETGKLLVLKTFSSKTGGRVIGGRVREGSIPKDTQFEITRQGEVVGKGKINSLQRNKVQVEKLKEGEEGGLLISSTKAIEERDILVFFYEKDESLSK